MLRIRYTTLVVALQYKSLKLVLWDHQHSSFKMRTIDDEFVIIAVENSLELEEELRKRFEEATKTSLLTMAPSFTYLGMFAGPTKPKPFDRKRANLTPIKQSKLPPLSTMREIAMERHNGPEKPTTMIDFSRRILIALDHIHEGQVIFRVFAAALPQMAYCRDAVLVLDHEGIVFENDTMNIEGTPEQTSRTLCAFTDINAWGIYDYDEDYTQRGVQIDKNGTSLFFAVDDINNFRVCFEYFWNLHRTERLKLSVQPGTTHGRRVSVARCIFWPLLPI